MIRRSNKFFFAACVTAIVLAPAPAFAQVVISEFLYDAPGSDTDQEFVELFNAGSSAVDLTKWKINDGSNHILNVPPKNGGTGAISVAPGAYVILVDNGTNFIALHGGITSAIIDTVLSLPNTAGIISLIDGEGATVDSVSYIKDNGGAGDENSLQRTSVSGTTFVAAAATLGSGTLTPSSGNAGSNASTPTNQTTQTGSEGGSSDSSYTISAIPKIFADGGSDRTVIVGANTEFSGRAYNQRKESLDSVRFQWNFGDGSTSEGTSVFHRFEYPGRYAVILRVLDNIDVTSDQIIVIAEFAKLFLSALPDGGVAIENRGGRTLDLSRWVLRLSGREFVLPENSFILGNATMRIPKNTLGFLAVRISNSTILTKHLPFAWIRVRAMLHFAPTIIRSTECKASLSYRTSGYACGHTRRRRVTSERFS